MEEKKLKWISVNERLPEAEKEVFVYGQEKPQEYGNGLKCLFPPITRVWLCKRAETPSQHTDGNGFLRLYGYGIYEITHWFPVPTFEK